MEITKANTKPQTSAPSAPQSEPLQSRKPVTAITTIIIKTNACGCRMGFLSVAALAAAGVECLWFLRALQARGAKAAIAVAVEVMNGAAGFTAAIF